MRCWLEKSESIAQKNDDDDDKVSLDFLSIL